MKNLNNSWNNLKNYLYKHYGQESGKMIVHTGIITWAMASLAQVGAVVFNDKIPKEQKKFLVPQEIADGVINILAFYAVTNSMKSLAGRLVSTGKWSNNAIRKFVCKNAPNLKMGELSTNLAKTFKNNEDFYKVYSPFKNGVDMISTTTGSIIACNAITPFLRNSIGSKQQKKSLAKNGLNNELNNDLKFDTRREVQNDKKYVNIYKSPSSSIKV